MESNTPEAWDRRAKANNTSWEAALWSEYGQNARFMRALHHVRPQPSHTLLDFGCGTGRFCSFLPRDVAYTGVDWSKTMLDRAREENTRGTYVDKVPGWKFDHVVCIGPFNLADNWSKESTWATINRLWEETAKRSLTVSLLRSKAAGCLTYNPLEAINFARMRSDRFELDCSYLDNDMMLVMRR